MDQSLIDLGRRQYEQIEGQDEVERDEEGFIILRPKAKRVDQRLESLTTNIDALETKLKALRSSKAEMDAIRKTPEYKEQKKEEKKRGKKKKRERLINMVFNNADEIRELEEADAAQEEAKDGKKPRKKKSQTTLDTTYGKRFSPIVSMLHDSITDFGRIAAEIEAELETPQGRARTMYRSTQTSNLISAKNSQLSALRELGSIAKTLSDLEYKRDKEKKAEQGDTTKAISNLAAQYLRTSDEVGGKKKRKGSKKDRAKGSFEKSAKKMGYNPDVDDDDDDDEEVERSGKTKKNYELAQQFAKVLEKRGNEFSFSPYERHLDIEGKYKFLVVCDPLDPEHTWEFIAVDPKTNKEIKGFKKEYGELMPKKKRCRMKFDIQKKRCTDLNSSKTYKLVFAD